MLETVRRCTTACEMRKLSLDAFEKHTLLNNPSARRQHYLISMLESEDVSKFLNHNRQQAPILKPMKITVDDDEMVMN